MVTHTDSVRIAQLKAENEALRLDGILQNLATRVGSMGADKRLATRVNPPDTPDRDTVDCWYEGNKFFAKIINNLPKYATKKWAIYGLHSDEDSGALTQDMQKLIDSVAPIFTEALITARKYGGSAIVLGCNDGEDDYTQPVNKDKLKSLDIVGVREGGISQEIFVNSWGIDPMKPDYNKPVLWQFSSDSTLVHSSRLLLFNGFNVGDRRSREKYNGFGAPLLQQCVDELRDYKGALDTIALALLDFNKLVVKLKGLVDLIAAKKKKEIEERLRLYQYTSSVMDAFVGDPDDIIDYLNRSFAGVKEMVDILKGDLGACADEPHTTFFNESPSGNTSGTDQMRNINSTVATYQEDNIRKPLEYLIDLWHHCADNPTKGNPPESWEITFPVIYELNETERAALEKTQAERMAILLKGNGNEGVISPLEAAEAIARDVPLGSVINLDARKLAAIEAAKELAEFEAEGMVVKQHPMK